MAAKIQHGHRKVDKMCLDIKKLNEIPFLCFIIQTFNKK